MSLFESFKMPGDFSYNKNFLDWSKLYTDLLLTYGFYEFELLSVDTHRRKLYSDYFICHRNLYIDFTFCNCNPLCFSILQQENFETLLKKWYKLGNISLDNTPLNKSFVGILEG